MYFKDNILDIFYPFITQELKFWIAFGCGNLHLCRTLHFKDLPLLCPPSLHYSQVLCFVSNPGDIFTGLASLNLSGEFFEKLISVYVLVICFAFAFKCVLFNIILPYTFFNYLTYVSLCPLWVSVSPYHYSLHMAFIKKKMCVLIL